MTGRTQIQEIVKLFNDMRKNPVVWGYLYSAATSAVSDKAISSPTLSETSIVKARKSDLTDSEFGSLLPRILAHGIAIRLEYPLIIRHGGGSMQLMFRSSYDKEGEFFQGRVTRYLS